MKLTTKPTRVTVRRVVKIENGPILSPSVYRRRFRVDTVVIEYTWKDGRFDVDSTFAVRMAGPWVKKDDTDAKDRASDMRPDSISWSSLEWDPQYTFLLPIIDMLRPGADLSMTILQDHEVTG